MTHPLRIGTRASRLALAQAREVAAALQPAIGAEVEIVKVRTRGDAISARHPAGGYEVSDGQFTAELERAVLDGTVDLAVHSYKDLPTDPVPGIGVVAVLPRADARDCLLVADGGGLAALGSGATVGTGSARRSLQLAAIRPDLVIRPIRGNVETRLGHMRRGAYDGVVLAAAGLDRLGFPIPPQARLSYDVMLPAPAQGAIAVQARDDSEGLIAWLEHIDDRPTRLAAEMERRLLREVGGGCLAPLGALAEVSDGGIRLRAAYFAPSPSEPVKLDLRGGVAESNGLVAKASAIIRSALGDAA